MLYKKLFSPFKKLTNSLKLISIYKMLKLLETLHQHIEKIKTVPETNKRH